MNNYHRLQFFLLCALFIALPLNLNAASFNSAANAYERGDYNSAIKQFTELAHHNNEYAQYTLGKIFANGEGVDRDYVRAYSWLQLAEQNGVEIAATLKHKISRKMSRDQLKQAQRLAEQWRYESNTPSRSTEIADPAMVRQVQQVLSEKGYYYDRIDGLVGGRTRKAIRRYQQAAGLPQDGRITNELLNSMQITENFVDPSPGWKSDSGREELAQLKKKLRRLSRRVKKSNAAEPWVLRRLEQLAGEEAALWSHLVLEENFTDVNYRGGADWRVMSGNFQLQRGTGLIVTPESNWGSVDNYLDDLPLRMLDALLNQAQLQQPERRFSKIEIQKDYANSFALQVATGPLNDTEALIFSCSYDGSATSGYRLVLQPGSSNQGIQAKLFTVSGNNASEVKTFTNLVRINDNASHNIEWTRSRNGEMTVTVNGQTLLQVTSSRDSKPFAKVGIAHVGNRIVLKTIKLLDSDEDYSRI